MYTKIANPDQIEDIKKIAIAYPYYMGVKQTEKQIEEYCNMLIEFYAHKINGRILIITYDNNEPIAMITGTPIYKYNCWMAADVRTTRLSNSTYFDSVKNGIKLAYYELCEIMESRGFYQYYTAIQSSSY